MYNIYSGPPREGETTGHHCDVPSSVGRYCIRSACKNPTPRQRSPGEGERVRGGKEQRSKDGPVLCPRFRGHRIGHFYVVLRASVLVCVLSPGTKLAETEDLARVRRQRPGDPAACASQSQGGAQRGCGERGESATTHHGFIRLFRKGRGRERERERERTERERERGRENEKGGEMPSHLFVQTR